MSTRKEVKPRRNFELSIIVCLLILVFVVPLGNSISVEDEELVKILTPRNSGNTLSAFFTGTFSAITAFGCRDDTTRFELLRGLSQNFLSSNVLEVNIAENLLQQLAWARGYKSRELSGNAHQVLFTLDLDCPGIDEFLLKADENKMFSAPYKWLILKKFEDVSEINSIFADIRILPDSEVIIWQKSNKSSDKLLSIYRLGLNSSNYEIEDLGYWSAEAEQLVVRDEHVTSRRRKNLKQIELRSALVITDPDTINHLTDYHDRHIDTITKCDYPWNRHLTEMLNATISFQITGTWGYRNANGSWSGMTGMLQRDEIDFGGSGSFLMADRMSIVQYIPLVTPTGSRFIFRRPPLSTVANLFKLPFRNSVWFGFLALTILVIILLYPAMRFEWSHQTYNVNELRSPNLSEDLLVVVGAVSQQGSWYEPRAVPTRIIVLMFLLLALNLYAAYTANIVALLQSTTSSINTLQDLLDSPLALGVHETVYNRYYFQSFKDPVRKAVYERIEPPNSKKNYWVKEIGDGIERIRRGYYAFHVEYGCAYKFIQETYQEEEKCGFHEIDYLNVFNPHHMVRKRSPYLELLRVAALRFQETGMRTHEHSRLYTKKPVCGSARRFLSVGLMETHGAFWMLLCGCLLSVCVLLVEWITKILKARYKSSRLESLERQKFDID